MTLPDEVRRALPDDAGRTWETVAPLLPRALYLGGGTALAVHIAHRVSRDLDFFYHEGAVDLASLADTLATAGPFVVTQAAPGTLNGLFSQTKLQFLHADEVEPQRRLEPTRTVGGIEVAGIGDILAMKLKVIIDRGELRDYFDLMAIERDAGRTVEEGLGLFLQRYGRPSEPFAIEPVVRALGYLGDVDEDELLPATKEEVERYWRRRQPEIVRNAARFGD